MGKIFQVFVVGLKGEKLTVDVSESEAKFNAMTISKFKEKLLQKLPGQAGIASGEDLRLLFANFGLEKDKKFSDYNITDKSTILMVLRLPGGMEQ
ncbi:polyubiquitin [Carcharodon carcharias]|uniref:polyubiquitin n=1 Tax=Carcharodon carcharias TaxID=13397 RepID=UPI001B7ED486|nr:polyubiquitin [Carcharodon carcharias]